MAYEDYGERQVLEVCGVKAVEIRVGSWAGQSRTSQSSRVYLEGVQHNNFGYTS